MAKTFKELTIGDSLYYTYISEEFFDKMYNIFLYDNNIVLGDVLEDVVIDKISFNEIIFKHFGSVYFDDIDMHYSYSTLESGDDLLIIATSEEDLIPPIKRIINIKTDGISK